MSSVMGIVNDSKPVQTIINDIVNYSKHYNMRDGIDLQPSYQRAYIWSSDFRDKLLYSLIRNYPIGNICLRVRINRNQRGAMREVVDGQQRLTTIYHFVHNEYAIQSDISRKIIDYIAEYIGNDDDDKLKNLKLRLRSESKVLLLFRDLPDAIQGNINAYPLALSIITNAGDDEIAEYFRFLQKPREIASRRDNQFPARNDAREISFAN